MKLVGVKVLVTGAGGFIGSHLCEALLELGADVTALVHYNARNSWGNLELCSTTVRAAMRVVSGNIEDPEFVQRHMDGQQCVFHLAALIGIPYSYSAPRSYVRTNVEGTLNVLEASRRFGVQRLVHTSTSEVYGTAQYVPIDERHPLQGQSPYSASKIAADKLVESYYLSFALPTVTVRPFNTFGPRQSARAIVPTIVSQALTQPTIRLGALDPVRDLTFVHDTVSAFIASATAEAAVGQVINVGTGRGISVADLAATLLRVVGCDKPIVSDTGRFRPASSEVMRLVCDNRKAEKVLGWKASHTLEQGLQKTVAFVAANLDLYKSADYVV